MLAYRGGMTIGPRSGPLKHCEAVSLRIIQKRALAGSPQGRMPRQQAGWGRRDADGLLTSLAFRESMVEVPLAVSAILVGAW